MALTLDATDEQAILAHVHSIFRAYLDRDRSSIRRLHTEDWRGFQVGSRRIIRGIDEYMAAAEATLSALRAVRYEMLDTEVIVSGDFAVIYYVARDYLQGEAGSERTTLLRAVDVYRREPGGWNQAGSNVVALPDGPAGQPDIR